jgi:hypothetical protein
MVSFVLVIMSLTAYINLMLVAQRYDFDFCISLAGQIRSESTVVSCDGEVLLLCERQFFIV